MKATRALVDNLRAAASYIEQYPENYNWSETESCNLGILAQMVGIDEDSIDQLTSDYALGCWSHLAEKAFCFCKSTGSPLDSVFETLATIGLDKPDDYDRLEHLVDDQGEQGDFTNPVAVITYFRALAVKLETELQTASVN